MTNAEPVELTTPLADDAVARLHAGDHVLLSGVVYTARDAAHERLAGLLARGEALPVDLRGQVLYYCGPTPPRPGRPIGAAGPTTATRMDPYTPALLALGLRGMIGKGRRGPEVRAALARYRAVYFAAVEGTAALLGQRVRAAEVVAFPDLGPEAIYRLEVDRFPVVVANDIYGQDVYDLGRRQYARPPAAPG
ncbi:MAG: Fe-S-containing hydro-lyase [Armatimonadota bacterium]|nr:Fe-S-containing hydro-lyase [Armatimonadota bacterium]MDR7485036.1 Fe-S-containing hydro-lyase [Armatimonadota bacterium]MDR7534492.1 Fe-S-containing hydro-lyase [Armatimonadota bacterium]MDR7535550.1 Fe-S-containing hydro-lyase [Armatimonadota bacterium]